MRKGFIKRMVNIHGIIVNDWNMSIFSKYSLVRNCYEDDEDDTEFILVEYDE